MILAFPLKIWVKLTKPGLEVVMGMVPAIPIPKLIPTNFAYQLTKYIVIFPVVMKFVAPTWLCMNMSALCWKKIF